MMLEPLLNFETVFIENRPIMELVDSDFTYRSHLLDEWYQGRAATYGINVPGTVYRMDDVPISLRPALECHHPSDLEILKGIEKRVQELNMESAQSEDTSLRPARDKFGSNE